MKALIKIILLFSFLGPNFALAEGNKWLSLVEDILNNKDRVETNYVGYYFVREEIINLSESSLIANYISVVVRAKEGSEEQTDFDSVISIDFLDLVWEKWDQLPNGDWHLDQWTFRVTPYGDYMVGRHNDVVKSLAKERNKSQTLETETEENLKAKYMALKQGWLNKLP